MFFIADTDVSALLRLQLKGITVNFFLQAT